MPDLTRTAIGTWSGGRFMRFGEPLDDDRMLALLRPDERIRTVIYVTTALLTAAAVAACGIVGFVGLVVPHAVRRVWGSIHRTLLPLVFLVSGCFLVLADAVARTVVRPAELPVGVVTALVGVPLFALLLRRTLA